MQFMHVDDVLAVLTLLGELEVWVDGGWGVDALLGEQTREHADLDLVVPHDQLDAVRHALATAGFDADTQLLCHTGYELRPQDRQDVANLRRRFDLA